MAARYFRQFRDSATETFSYLIGCGGTARALVIETTGGMEIGVVQIAGLVAQRIVTFSQEGDNVGVGQRFGLIRFGSRLDVYLPSGARPRVGLGDKVKAQARIAAAWTRDACRRFTGRTAGFITRRT